MAVSRNRWFESGSLQQGVCCEAKNTAYARLDYKRHFVRARGGTAPGVKNKTTRGSARFVMASLLLSSGVIARRYFALGFPITLRNGKSL